MSHKHILQRHWKVTSEESQEGQEILYAWKIWVKGQTKKNMLEIILLLRRIKKYLVWSQLEFTDINQVYLLEKHNICQTKEKNQGSISTSE